MSPCSVVGVGLIFATELKFIFVAGFAAGVSTHCFVSLSSSLARLNSVDFFCIGLCWQVYSNLVAELWQAEPYTHIGKKWKPLN